MQDLTIVALARSAGARDTLKAAYPSIQVTHGSLDDTSLIATEAAKADVVLNLADADHVAASKALVCGVKRRRLEGKTSHLIHVSGAGMLMFEDIDKNVYGESSDKIFDDYDNISDVVSSIPDHAFHRDVDKVILDAGEDRYIKTAIVSPPTIYGIGRGVGNKRSAQIPMLAEAILKTGKGFQVGEGRAKWTNVHIFDLSDLFVSLLRQALIQDSKATSGADGYYFAENGEHVSYDSSRNLRTSYTDKPHLLRSGVMYARKLQILRTRKAF